MTLIFFSEKKILNYNTVGINIIDNYKFNFFDKKILNKILEYINNEKPVLLISSCKTSYACLLYTNELYKCINNKIILLLFSPIITLNKIYYNLDYISKNHSIFKNLKNYKKDEDEIINNVFNNKKICKYIFNSENDDIFTNKYLNNLLERSNNYYHVLLLNTRIHNILSLFFYGHSKNFDKLKKTNYYINSDELLKLTSLWETINFDILIEKIYLNKINELTELFLKYNFIKIKNYIIN